MSETLGLKNINLLTKEQFDGIAEPASDELYAVETPTVVETYSDDAGNWYRVYSDGWVEQGGIIPSLPDNWSITFLKPFRDGKYILQGEVWGTDSITNLGINQQNTTNAIGNNYTNGTGQVSWYACGYVAE